MIEDRDPCINQELGWKSIKKVIRKIQKERDAIKAVQSRPKDELFGLRISTCDNEDLLILQWMKELESKVRKRERRSAHLWQIRSRSTQLKIGDPPSQYFFKLVTPKWIQESIKKLAMHDRRIMEDELEILARVFTHYRNLYKKDLWWRALGKSELRFSTSVQISSLTRRKRCCWCSLVKKKLTKLLWGFLKVSLSGEIGSPMTSPWLLGLCWCLL